MYCKYVYMFILFMCVLFWPIHGSRNIYIYMYIHAYIIYMFTSLYYLRVFNFGPFMGVEIWHQIFRRLMRPKTNSSTLQAEAFRRSFGNCADHLLGTLLLYVPTICLEHYYYMYRPFAWNIIIMCADHLLGTLLLYVPTICLEHYYYVCRPFAWNIIIMCADHLLGTLLLYAPTICLEHYYYMRRPFAWNTIIICADHLLGNILNSINAVSSLLLPFKVLILFLLVILLFLLSILYLFQI